VKVVTMTATYNSLCLTHMCVTDRQMNEFFMGVAEIVCFC
jgi:hypothetical protein